jgi:O-antigen ligase
MPLVRDESTRHVLLRTPSRNGVVKSSARSSVLTRVHSALVIVLIGWGAAAFGAVYPWGYRVLAGAAIAAGTMGLYASRGRQRLPLPIVMTFGVLLVSILAQQMPLPRPVIERISPATLAIAAQRNIAFDAASSWHALSIDPSRTWTGLFLLASLGAFWLGLTAALNEPAALRIVGGVVTCGFAIAVLGFVGLANHTGKVLWIWQPWSSSSPFGPFINRNHYAGWMLMTVPLGAGYLQALLTRERAPRSWRARIAWLSTRHANVLIMLALALTVMMLSVIVSLSRSGIICLAAGLTAFVWLATRQMVSRARRVLTMVCLAAVATGCVGWAGVDRIGSRFAELQVDRSGGRRGIWRDSVTMARTFPLAGTGLDTFGVATLFYQTSNLHEHYEEAHNDYLQIAAEGGLLVGVPALLLAVVTAVQVRRRFRERLDTEMTYWLRVGAVVGIVTIALQELTEFSLQMPGNAALFSVLLAIAVHKSGKRAAGNIRESTAARPVSLFR